MKLLVLGGSGLIGNELIKKTSFFNKVLVTYNNHNLKKLNFSPIKFSFPDDLEILKKIILTERPDVVINLIGKSNLSYCEQNKDEIYQLNVIFPKKICDLCNEINSKFVQISSDYVFDGKNGNYKENDQTNPINFYGYTKQISEEEILRFPQNVVIRTSLVYDLTLKTNFIKFVSEKLNKHEKVFAFNDVMATPILVDELIMAILKIIDSEYVGIFHISGNECISRYEFAKIIAKKFGFQKELIFPISIKSIKQNIPRPQNSCLNNEKIRDLFNIEFSSLKKNFKK
jgi:dTDP-4-dehydrorhamnose reductase